MTFFSLFLGVCLAWTFLSRPAMHSLRLISPSTGGIEKARNLQKIQMGLRALDRFGAAIPLPIMLAIIVCSIIGEVELMRRVAEHLPADRAIEHGWPMSFIITEHYFSVYHTKLLAIIRYIIAFITGVQALALRTIWVRFAVAPPARHEWYMIAVAIAISYAFSIFVHTMEQPDLYAYVIIAKLGFQSYHPPLLDMFSGSFQVLDRVWNVAWGLQNYPYGPLYIAMDRAALANAPTLYDAIVCARALAAIAIALLAFAVWRLGFGARGALLVALNPAIIHEYVVEGHNDIFPIALCCLGFVLVRRSALLGLCAVVAAGLIKIPYALVGTLAFASIPRPIPRTGYAVAATAITIGLSLLFGGMPYIESMRFHAGVTSTHQPATVLAIRGALLAIVAAGIAAAVLFRRSKPVIAYVLPQLAMSSYPWYMGMGIPYAMLDRTGLPIFLISFPISVMMNDFWFAGKVSFLFALLGAAAVAVSQYRGDATSSDATLTSV